MQNPAWVALLKHIPAQVHENLMVVTPSGIEIAVQSLLRIDREYVAIKGRLAGSQEAGRVFFIAYDQIDILGFQQEIKEEKFQEMFRTLVMPEPTSGVAQQAGDSKAAAAAAAAAVSAAVAAAYGGSIPAPALPEPSPPPLPPAVEAPTSSSSGSKNINGGIKSVVLERFRSRNLGSGVRPKLPRTDEPPPANG